MDKETQRLLLLEAVGAVMGAATVSRDLFAPDAEDENNAAWMLFEGIRRKCELTLEFTKR